MKKAQRPYYMHTTTPTSTISTQRRHLADAKRASFVTLRSKFTEPAAKHDQNDASSLKNISMNSFIPVLSCFQNLNPPQLKGINWITRSPTMPQSSSLPKKQNKTILCPVTEICVWVIKKIQKQALFGGMSIKLNNFCYSVFKKQLSQIVPNVLSKTSVTSLCFTSAASVCADIMSVYMSTAACFQKGYIL